MSALKLRRILKTPPRNLQPPPTPRGGVTLHGAVFDLCVPIRNEQSGANKAISARHHENTEIFPVSDEKVIQMADDLTSLEKLIGDTKRIDT